MSAAGSTALAAPAAPMPAAPPPITTIRWALLISGLISGSTLFPRPGRDGTFSIRYESYTMLAVAMLNVKTPSPFSPVDTT
jgi:hypothetical protein